MTLDPPPYPAYYRATREYRALGLWRGDLVRYDPRRAPSISVIRHLPPNHGGLLLAIEDGALTQISADPDVVPLRRVQARPAPPPPAATPLPLVSASDRAG